MKRMNYLEWDGQQREFSISDDYKGSLDVIDWGYKEYGDKLIYACSFGIEGIVLIDLISKINDAATIVFLDTDFHFKETYQLIDKVKAKYPHLNIIFQKPELSPKEQAETYGEQLWESRPDQCCQVRKVEPLKKALAGYDAWLSGLRREQSETRRHTEFINRDDKFQMIKICPLIHWTETDIWNYVKQNHLPYNSLHDQGYPSIGCEHCTLPVSSDGNNSRAGRWSAFDKVECGLHWS